MSPHSKSTTPETTNDSPAFRLRPRAEPKSYYTIRLEYSANPAAFTRERPRSAKRKSLSSSQRSSGSYSKSRNRNNTAGGNSRSANQRALLNNRYPNGPPLEQPSHILSKEDLEREERRKQLQREIAQSITTDTPISPFMQRLGLNELKPETVYEHNYITLRIKSIRNLKKFSPDIIDAGNSSDIKCLICECCGIDDGSLSPMSPESTAQQLRPSLLNIDVHLFDKYADESIIKVDKILNIGKFKTGPITSEHDRPKQHNGSPIADETDGLKYLNFNVIVGCNSQNQQAIDDSMGPDVRKKTLIPFISVTDMIEELTEPYVEMLPSPIVSPDVKPVIPDVGNSDDNGVKVNVCAGAISTPIVQ